MFLLSVFQQLCHWAFDMGHPGHVRHYILTHTHIHTFTPSDTSHTLWPCRISVSPFSIQYHEFFRCLCFILLTLLTQNLSFSTYFRPEVDLATTCWNYHLFGIPVDKTTGLGVVLCEIGRQLERTVDIQLAGYVSWNYNQMGQEGVLACF